MFEHRPVAYRGRLSFLFFLPIDADLLDVFDAAVISNDIDPVPVDLATLDASLFEFSSASSGIIECASLLVPEDGC